MNFANTSWRAWAASRFCTAGGSPRRFDSSRAAMSRRAHPSQNRGRGLYIMHALMDRVVVDSGLNGTRILLEKALGAPPAG